MGQQNLPPKETRQLLVQTPAGDILFYDRVEAEAYRKRKPWPVAGSDHPEKSRWPDHKFCGCTQDDEEGWVRFYYLATWAAQEAYNFELGVTLGDEWPEVRQTWVIKRPDYVPGARGAPPTFGSAYVWTYIGEEQRRMDRQTDGLFVVLTMTWRDIRNPIEDSYIDLETGTRRTREKRMVAAGTDGTEVQADGSYADVQGINTAWSIQTTKELPGLAGNATKTRTYETTVNYRWPRVLRTPVIDVIPAADGGIGKIWFVPDWLRPEYYGPCKAIVTDTWSKDEPTITTPTQMLEDSVTFDGALLQISIPACLHKAIRLFESSGDGTREYAPYQLAWDYKATNFIDWPASITVQDECEPVNGGFMRRTVVVQRPPVGVSAAINLELAGISTTGFSLSWSAENAIGTPAYFLDIATDPEFRFGFLPGYNGKSKGTGTTETVTLTQPNKVYYCRVRWGAVTSNTVTGLLKPVPQLRVERPAGNALANNASVNLGNVFVGEETAFEFVLKNVGTWVLNDLAPVLTTGTAYELATVAATLEAGGSLTLTVRVTAAADGALSDVLTIHSSDGTNPAFVLNLSATGVSPEMDLKQPASTPCASGDDRDFGSVDTGAYADLVFTIKNTGTGELRGIAASLSGADAEAFSIQGTPPETVAAGGSATLTVRYAPGYTASGVQTAVLQIANTDNDENPYVVDLEGTAVPVPEIAVMNPLGVDLTNGVGSYDLGRVQNPSTGAAHTFTIRNLGGATLSGLAVSMAGTDAADFDLGALGASSLAAGASTTFTVSFQPASGGGVRVAAIEITSNDADEDPFVIGVEATEGASLSEIQVETPPGYVQVDGAGVLSWGNVAQGSSPAERTVIVRNIGSADLTGVAASKVGGGAAAVVLGTPAASVGPGSFTSFNAALSTAAAGYKEVEIEIASNDSDENPFNLPVHAIVYPANGLKSGQSASVVIGQADFVSDSSTVNSSTTFGAQAVAVCPATGRLAVCDTTRHRVLIWNSVPSSNGVAANYVIGQTTFTGATSSAARNRLNNPTGCCFSPDGTRLLVADRLNNRVQIYDMGALATGMNALWVIGQSSYTTATSGVSQTKMDGPSDVLVTSGGKVLVADLFNNRVLIWNSIPAANLAAANVVVGQSDFVSGGTNVGASGCPWGLALAVDSSGKMYVGCAHQFSGSSVAFGVRVWNSVPTSNNVSADYVIGRTAFGLETPVVSRSAFGSAPWGVAVSAAGRLAVCCDTRVLIWYSAPTATGAGADAVLGQGDFVTESAIDPPTEYSIDSRGGLCWRGNDLIVADGLRTLIFTP